MTESQYKRLDWPKPGLQTQQGLQEAGLGQARLQTQQGLQSLGWIIICTPE